MPYITISESDKSHVDEIFINSSYSGKVLTSDAPISEHIFDGDLEFEYGIAYITEAFSMDITKSYKITVADTSFTNEGLTYNSTTTEPPICDKYWNTNGDVQVWKLAEAFEEMYGQVAINPSMITDGIHHVTIDEAETPTPSHLFDENLSYTLNTEYSANRLECESSSPVSIGVDVSKPVNIKVIVGDEEYKLENVTCIDASEDIDQTAYAISDGTENTVIDFSYIPDGFESVYVICYVDCGEDVVESGTYRTIIDEAQ